MNEGRNGVGMRVQKASAWRNVAAWLLCGLLACPALAQDPKALASLKKHVLSLRKDPLLKNADWGYSLRKLDGTQLFALNPDKFFIPASTLKTITTAAALSTLKPGSVYTTFIEYTGKIDRNGTLTGDLYIRGTGDPTLGSERYPGLVLPWDSLLNDIAMKVAASGIRTIKGHVIADDAAFVGAVIPEGSSADDLGNYYGASVHALNLHENYYRVFFAPGTATGEVAQISRFEPEVPGLNLQSFVRYGRENEGDNSLIYGGNYNFNKRIVGRIPNVTREFGVKGSVPDPPLWIAQLLKTRLEYAKVTVQGSAHKIGEVPTDHSDNRHLLAIYASPTISEVVEKTNTSSVNLYAESLIRRMGMDKTKPGSVDRGLVVVRDYLTKLKLPVDQLVMRDGSGLSSTNQLTPGFLTQFLVRMTSEPYYAHFYNSLAVVGVSGTCKDMCQGTIAMGKVHAKSGTLRGVISYTGYVQGADGTEYAFSILINRHRGQARQVRRLCETVMIKMAAL